MSAQPISISIVVPVYNNSQDLRECLSAIIRSSVPNTEILVVDDASTDDVSSITNEFRVPLIRLPKNSGVAAARNAGARHVHGEILFFIDADVVIPAGAVERVVHWFQGDPGLAAVFGSYDARPRAKGTVSQYRNLLHHFVHQNGKMEASTFWAGCGAIRRSVFDAVGGFDEKRYRYPSIEDIELGYRLKKAGYRILLDKSLQATHLKKWTLGVLIKTDITRRALPWARLILERKTAPDDLNLRLSQRLSGLLVMLGCLLTLVSVFQIEILAIAVVAFISVIILNRDLYRFFWDREGVGFAGVCILLHLLYFLYSGMSYLYAWIEFYLRNGRLLDQRTDRMS